MAMTFQLKDFDGPLDLLLFLINKEKIDIKDIFVSQITDQYIDSVRNTPGLDMDDATDFLVMAATPYLIRVLPLTLIRKPIRSVFLRSFLFYVPYVTLSVMTFPAIMNATQSPIAGAAAMVIGIVAAWCGLGLLPVSLVCCATVLILEHFIV